mmetsp:Transcript_6969/g.880  ORF Transcript_6969/g.880 Transcript_6969/m.880 type:complete len:92 (-) Transcript_6969:657-932(-)
MDTENINYESFTGKKSDTQRSDTVFLVKNLATNTSVATLQEFCGRYGPLGRVSINPSHTLGVVEFLNPNHAATAFNALSYKHINKVPVYLE